MPGKEDTTYRLWDGYSRFQCCLSGIFLPRFCLQVSDRTDFVLSVLRKLGMLLLTFYHLADSIPLGRIKYFRTFVLFIIKHMFFIFKYYLLSLNNFIFTQDH